MAESHTQGGPPPNEPRLSGPHRTELEVGSGIPAELIARRGYETITTKVGLKQLGFGDSQLNVPALLIPLWNVHGEIAGYQCKPDSPRIRSGKALKYETPAGMKMLIDVPPSIRHQIGNPSVPLWITEGVKKVDRAAAAGLCCVGLLGVWNWRGSNADGGMTALADWESIAVKGRTVVIAFDSDVVTKRPVLAAMSRLREFLKNRGAEVQICLLPPGPAGEKTGLDDYFVRGGTVQDLMRFVQSELPHVAGDDAEPEYVAKDDGLWWMKPTAEGTQPVRMCNFVARITHEVTQDDGVEKQKMLEVELALGGKTQRVEVPLDKFGSQNWHMQCFGATAMVSPGIPPNRLIYGIQSISSPGSTTIYTHTGWRRIDRVDLYLSAGAPIGPLGPLGPLPETIVEPAGSLGGCVLPSPPVADELRKAALVVDDFLNVGPLRVTAPVQLAVFRAVLGEVDFALFIEGVTGAFKTAVAALAQAYFGKGFDARHLPASWSSTANALEDVMFRAKDMVVVIDDFVPAHAGEKAAMDAKADRVFRGAANGSARQRLKQDGTPRPERPPRCLPIATGEYLPSGYSAVARTLVTSISKGDIDKERLTRLQEDAATGRLASAMAGFLQWCAGQLDQLRGRLRNRVLQLRPSLQGRGWHERTCTTVAELTATAEIVADFLVHAGALDGAEQQRFVSDLHETLVAVGDAQGQVHRDIDPVDQYLRLLGSALASGRAHLCSAGSGDGAPQGNELRAGWTTSHAAVGWTPRGEQIGWLDENDNIYLLPNAADAVVQRLARDQGSGLVVGPALRKRLHERGKLASTEQRGQQTRLLVRKTICGTRHEVLHLTQTTLFGELSTSGEVAQVAQSTASPAATVACGGPRSGPLPDRGGPTATGSGPIPADEAGLAAKEGA